MSEKTKGQLLSEELSYKKKSVYDGVTAEAKEKAFEYARGYMAFLNCAKTEREAVAVGIRMAEEKGYTPFRFGEKLKAGDKRYYNNRDKSLFLLRKGSKPLDEDGVRIMAAHVDAPRIDLKQNPLYEDAGLAYFKTHYYGGIRKYQWVAIPLALHGTVIRKDGTAVHVSIGEEETDPVFYISDLLPHLAREQSTKPLGTAFSGESLNVLIGNMPYEDEEAPDRVKLNVLSILNERYGITEIDFQSAELSVVPALRARDVGLDRALIGAYGHDDRVCAYPALTALLDLEDESHTVLTVFADKEETGSDGTTGMQCSLILDILEDLAKTDAVSGAAVRAASKCLSADVNAGFDPNYSEVFERRNAAMLSAGAVMSKYTGAGGKSSTSDASAEFVGFVRRIFDTEDIVWQTAELGKVDIGGGGTVAKYIANLNIDTVDIGVSVLSMHAPMEIVSKMDVYMLYRAFSAFCRL